MIRNYNLEELDLFIVHARPEPVLNESSSNLLNGEWFVQTIGDPAEKLKIKIVCKWDVVRLIMSYYTTKSYLYVTFLDMDKVGFILNTPTYDLGETDATNPKYTMDFELAVIQNV